MKEKRSKMQNEEVKLVVRTRHIHDILIHLLVLLLAVMRLITGLTYDLFKFSKFELPHAVRCACAAQGCCVEQLLLLHELHGHKKEITNGKRYSSLISHTTLTQVLQHINYLSTTPQILSTLRC